MKEKEIREAFRYHSSNPDMIKKHEEIRRTLTEAVVKVAGICPDSRERSCFITLMQQAQMMANASIAIHGDGKVETDTNLGDLVYGGNPE